MFRSNDWFSKRDASDHLLAFLQLGMWEMRMQGTDLLHNSATALDTLWNEVDITIFQSSRTLPLVCLGER